MATKSPKRLYYDNKRTISLIHNLIHHDQRKHVEVDRHFIREKIESGEIGIPHVSSSEQTIGILTKG